jgi:hypothetical protein
VSATLSWWRELYDNTPDIAEMHGMEAVQQSGDERQAVQQDVNLDDQLYVLLLNGDGMNPLK